MHGTEALRERAGELQERLMAIEHMAEVAEKINARVSNLADALLGIEPEPADPTTGVVDRSNRPEMALKVANESFAHRLDIFTQRLSAAQETTNLAINRVERALALTHQPPE